MANETSDPFAGFIKSIPSRIRSTFNTELYFRLFVVLQCAGMLGILYLIFGYKSCVDTSVKEIGHFSELCWTWKLSYLFDPDEWVDLNNWLASIMLFGPFLIMKSVDWVSSARSKV